MHFLKKHKGFRFLFFWNQHNPVFVLVALMDSLVWWKHSEASEHNLGNIYVSSKIYLVKEFRRRMQQMSWTLKQKQYECVCHHFAEWMAYWCEVELKSDWDHLSCSLKLRLKSLETIITDLYIHTQTLVYSPHWLTAAWQPGRQWGEDFESGGWGVSSHCHGYRDRGWRQQH